MIDREMSIFTEIKNVIGKNYLPFLLEDNNLSKENEKLKEYYELICSLERIFYRVVRYEVYFNSFYPQPDSGIPDDEAIEYHVHSYISDLIILRNTLLQFFSETLRRDLKLITYNSKSVDLAFDVLKKNIFDGFEDVADLRNPHVHDGKFFLDSNITISKSMRVLLDVNYCPPEFDKEKLFEKVSEKKESAFNDAKDDWINKARKNNESITKMSDAIFGKSKEYLYAVLKIPE